MTKVVAGITTSVDGYITGPDDRPDQGLGEGAEPLHYWVFGGPWTYQDEHFGEATGEDKAYLDEAIARLGAVVGGRGTYDAADAWGGSNPWPVPFFIVTHHPNDAPQDQGFTFIDGLRDAIEQASVAAGDKDVSLMGGADVIRQALHAGWVDEFDLTIAPITLGGGKRLFDGFDDRITFEPIDTRQSQYATHIRYRVKRA